MEEIFAYTIVSLLIISIISTFVFGFIAVRTLLKLREIHLKATGVMVPCTFRIFGDEEYFAVKADDLIENSKIKDEEEISFFSEDELKERIQMLIQEDFKLPRERKAGALNL
ncbi:hypothetical protein [Leptospira licerasiae]|uniref:Uncharacterized protein n=1 Tax=Leptospira licerasiae str. MMD4847 TaxID=1049971 RepID=A0ABP2RCV7_9LEPT|nr:hypothetical protein [Leptospira licerasiae]EIE01425.1 hypothetical protein LEP1GSC185_3911 [Leptospira licerasiae serovar Varillal str. VAR 010]EJZ42315.1 hypothetical protein LEP1GSC178_0076 [Leptospira licerasiae str. MMD4847]